VLIHNLVHQATQRDILNTTTKTNIQGTLFPEVGTKSFCWPSFLPHLIALKLFFCLKLIALKLGYKSWGVTKGKRGEQKKKKARDIPFGPSREVAHGPVTPPEAVPLLLFSLTLTSGSLLSSLTSCLESITSTSPI
jgi:hypothetical protein